MVFKKYIILLSSIFLTLGFSVSPAFADSSFIDFESGTYTTGSINGQDGWSALGSAGLGCAVYDHAVSAQSLFSSFDDQSLRISDAVTSGCFGDQTFAKPLTDSVGETAATAGSFSNGTRQRHFEMQFDIASVTTSQQSGMHVSVSPDRGDGSRMSYLRFDDGTTGIDVFFIDAQGTTNPANFVETQVASGLDRSVAHKINLTMDMLDGASNDVVKVYIDDILVHTGTSWENYYRYDSEAIAEQSPRIIKTVLWRSSGTAHSGNAGNGFLFDNVSLLSGPIPQFDLHDKTTNSNNLINNTFLNGPNVVSHWNMNGNSNSYDGLNNGTDTSITYNTSNGKFGDGAGFNGSSSKILLPDSDYGMSNAFTFSAWIKTSSTGTYQSIVGRDISVTLPRVWEWRVSTTGTIELIRFDSSDNYIETVGSSGTVTDGNWHHVVATFDTINGSRIYIDGSQDGSSNNTTPNKNATGLRPTIGADSTTGNIGTWTSWFNGAIDDVGIFNRSLTSGEVASIYNSVTDLGLTLNNAAIEISASLPFAQSSKALNLSGSQTLLASDSASLDLSSTYTMEGWIKFDSLPPVGDTMYFFAKNDYDGSQSGYSFGIRNIGGVYQILGVAAGGAQTPRDIYKWDWTPSTNTWYHMALTADVTQASASTFIFYLDGVSMGNGDALETGSVSSIYNNNRPLRLGTDMSNNKGINYLDGKLDDVRIWNIVRTATQIDDYKDTELSGFETGLVGYYPFETL